jgi:PPOX class probable F420-dependent enzyme
MPKGYGITAEPGKKLTWDWAVGEIARSRSYWVTSTYDDGRPHAMPVWGVWVDDALHFSTDPNSRKGRNMTRDPRVAVHLESGDDVVILEGVVERVTDSDVLTRFADAYEKKYDFRPDPADPGGVTYVVRPRIAHTWIEKDFPNTATRWRFED